MDRKKAVFITTKNLDYLRNTQEICMLEKAYKVCIVGSYSSNYLKRVLIVYWKLLFISLKGVEKVFVGFAPQLVLPLWGWKLKKTKVDIDFFISLYDTMCFDRKKVKPRSLLGRLLKVIDKTTLDRADKIIVDTKQHGKYFIQEFQVDQGKIEVLYLQADKKIYYPREVEKPSWCKGKFVILYFGSILPLQGIDIILQAVKLLRDEEQLYFEIIGPIKDEYEKVESINVKYFSWLSQDELANHIAYADLCLAGHFNDTIMKAKRTIPGKAYIYRCMDKPMILGDNMATRELFEDQEGIYFVKMGEGGALAELILACAKQEIKTYE